MRRRDARRASGGRPAAGPRAGAAGPRRSRPLGSPELMPTRSDPLSGPARRSRARSTQRAGRARRRASPAPTRPGASPRARRSAVSRTCGACRGAEAARGCRSSRRRRPRAATPREDDVQQAASRHRPRSRVRPTVTRPSEPGDEVEKVPWTGAWKGVAGSEAVCAAAAVDAVVADAGAASRWEGVPARRAQPGPSGPPRPTPRFRGYGKGRDCPAASRTAPGRRRAPRRRATSTASTTRRGRAEGEQAEPAGLRVAPGAERVQERDRPRGVGEPVHGPPGAQADPRAQQAGHDEREQQVEGDRAEPEPDGPVGGRERDDGVAEADRRVAVERRSSRRGRRRTRARAA